MGFWDFGVSNDEITINNVHEYISENFSNYSHMDELRDLEDILVRAYDEGQFSAEELLIDPVLDLVRKDLSIKDNIQYIVEVYSRICRDKNNLESRNLYRQFINLSIDNNSLIIDNNCGKMALGSFNDVGIALEFLKYLTSCENILVGTEDKRIALLTSYLTKGRQYYVDDRAFLSSAMTLVKTISPEVLKYGTDEEIQEVIYKKVLEDRKSNGIYDIDEGTFADIDKKLDAMRNFQEVLENLIKSADNEINIFNQNLANNKSELHRARMDELKALRSEATKILTDFKKSYLALLESERTSLVEDKDALLGEFSNESSKHIKAIELAGKSALDITNKELERIRSASMAAIKKLEDFVAGNDKLKSAIANAQTDEEFLKRLERIDQAASMIEKLPTAPSSETSSAKEVLLPAFMHADEHREVDPTVNHFFDTRIPFSTRYRELMELKKKDMRENHTIYHEKFDTILKLILLNKTPYMYGPSGCGKSHMIKSQLCRLLGINLVTNGYVLYEQDIIGYTNSGTGSYVPSNFYRCYKYGDAIFFDELDAGIANATVVLNNFIGEGVGSQYVFPNGEIVKRHPNFRIIAAGNTNGNGKTIEHNTRQKMDESVMQRVTPVDVNYDNRIEKQILEKYPDWFNFAVNFRKAIESVRNGSSVNHIGTFTTRDAHSVRQYKDEDCFTDEEIMLYEFIQTKDVDYLSQIDRSMQEQLSNGEFTNGGKRLYKIFRQTANLDGEEY